MNSKEIQVGVIVIDEALGAKSYKSYTMMHIWINLIGTFSLVTFYNTHIVSHKNGRCDFLRTVVKCHPDGNVVANM